MAMDQRGDSSQNARAGRIEVARVARVKPEEKVALSFRAPKSIRTRLKMYAASVERPVREIAIEALDEYLSRRET